MSYLEHGVLVLGQDHGPPGLGADNSGHGVEYSWVEHSVVRFGPAPLSKRLQKKSRNPFKQSYPAG